MEDRMARLSTFGVPVIAQRRMAGNRLFSSMRRISSGKRIEEPGDNPTDFGVAEALRTQIRNTDVSRRNVENMRDLIRTADSWLSVATDITIRMSQLATAAADGTKVQGDREKLQTEFLQLKTELTRLSQSARYNSLQITGRDQLLTYDLDKETFLFSQPDGTEKYHLNVKVLSGLSSENNLDFMFDSSKEYSLSQDGRTIYYTDSQDSLVRYNIEEGTLERDSSNTEEKGIDVDEQGRLWYAAETTSGSGVYSLRQQNLTMWTQDTTILDNTSITDMASSEFVVYRDRAYYVNTTGDYISRSLRNINDVIIELGSSEFTLNTTPGQFKISEQGLFIADVPSGGVVRVINVDTLENDTFSTGASSITDLAFNVDSSLISFNDVTEKSIYTLAVRPEDVPRFDVLKKVHISNGSLGFAGLSLDAGSHRLNFRVHNGPDALQETFVNGSDMRLHSLGLTRSNVETIQQAQQAVNDSQKALEIINVQRSTLGASESRLAFNTESLRSYSDILGMSESRLSDTDMAEEVSKMTNEQVKYEATASILMQANRLFQSALQLLSGGR